MTSPDERNHCAVITGAANGIGWATAQVFAERGYKVVIADVDGEAAAGGASELGEGHLGLVCDVSDEASVSAAFKAVVERFGGCDVLINNAGIGGSPLPTVEQNGAQFQKEINVHLTGSFLMSREFARGMIANGGGAIVNFSSIAGLAGFPGRNAYGAAKAGLVSMTRSMACEWAARGVRVNAVAPGYVETALMTKLVVDGLLDKARILRRCPMGRMIEPKEIAEAVWFLASPAASAITGTVLSVDAGWNAFGAAGDAFEEASI